LQNNNILVTEQFGFKSGLSIEDAAFKLTKSINRKMHVGGIFCDFAKAFGCVYHEILLPKLHFLGIQETMLSWFKCYLTENKRLK
jgi:hypothetical protein